MIRFNKMLKNTKSNDFGLFEDFQLSDNND